MIDVTQGSSPLVLGLPHTGTEVPAEVAKDLNERGLGLADTDWHIHDLYADLVEGVTTVRTPIHRYVIDVNRDPAGHSLYPGQNTTTLVPLTDFDGNSIWSREPEAAEISRRRDAYHAPYHAALTAEMERVAAIHGFAILYDCHSIRSEIPFLFEGRLPDFNVGTNMGTTCAPGIEALVVDSCQQATGYSAVLNGRFKGGWTTRHYGRPAQGWHAIQMELAQATYCDETPPWRYDPARSDRLRAHLSRLLADLTQWRPA
ncbi:N-formylglutamate deformylase [Tritonibacter horizontis]|uniref:N-formylglutamate amidohydrolase n=1 Tax=Tritonibacter horizontis TaxID=1768241 RepID=A0A132BXX6_9RHOB|nr:N-formylglutamate deformylase [Tritonibacter horizontis]KUP93241.1 N-formylglutamate amidohydrolase [Tritonibacter horizontis]